MTDDELFKIDREILKEHLERVNSAKSAQEKGKALEDLAEYLFSSIYGMKVVGRKVRTRTSEIDLILEICSPILSSYPFFKDVGPHIIVECKNWEKPIGANEIRDFSSDMSTRRILLGIILSKKGITKDAHEEIWNKFTRDGQIILVISKDDIKRIINGANLIEI